MTTPLGNITPHKIPASQAKPGNAEHSRQIAAAAAGQKSEQPTDWAQRVKTGSLQPAIFGILVIAIYVAGFGIWAARAPLSGAAVASGVVAASGQNLSVQHLEGGIVSKILVKEGDVVQQDQPLLILDSERHEQELERLDNALRVSQLRSALLEAERDGVEFVANSDLIDSFQQAGMEKDLSEQINEHAKRRQRHAVDSKIIDQQIAALSQQVQGVQVQAKATREQIAVVDEEIEVKAKLVKRKLALRSHLLLLKRTRSQLRGRLGEQIAEIGKSRSTISQAEARQLRLRAQSTEIAAVALNELRKQIAQAEGRLEHLKLVLERVAVRAPSAGTIIKLSKNTPGGVVRQGEELFVILPSSHELIVDARLSPMDVDAVSVGTKATLRFSSLNSRTTPEVAGEVVYLSADRLIDPVNQEPYYSARLKISESLPAGLDKSQIFPGMPVETFIQTGERTFLEYLVRPLTDSFSRAFREG
jgi:HlyD family type I secretion membrane fusion protein